MRRIKRLVACAALALAATASIAAPYTGTPIPLPATFEAEDFDLGGQGIGYRDFTSGNGGGEYRTGESVDIVRSSDPAGGGYVVNSFVSGEWLAYTVNVPASGAYDLAIRAANKDSAAAAFRIEVDGVNVTGTLRVPASGSWSAFQWVGKQAVSLTAGTRVVKLVQEGGYFDVNQVRVLATPVASPAPSSYAGLPYTGTPIALPVVFEAEDFDRGGQGVAYRDTTSGNSGGQYRTGESVDIVASRDAAGGGYVVNNFVRGEWLAYTVNVPASGTYDISIRAANRDSGAAAFHIEVDGVNVTGTLKVPASGSWSAFQWIGKQAVPLSAGKRVVKLVQDGGYFDVNRISVLSAAAAPVPSPSGQGPYGGTPVALPATFEAENFDLGGQGIGYSDSTAGNSGGQYRTADSVDIVASSDPAGGGYVVNSFVAGEWLAYTVNVPASGSYSLAIRAANKDSSAAAFRIEVDGVDVTGSLRVPASGSWSAFQWIGKDAIGLTAGQRVVKLVQEGGYFDVNQLRVLASSATPTPTPTPDPVPSGGEPPALAGKGYRLVKNWDFVNGIRDDTAMRAEFFTRYIYNNGQLDFLNDEWERYRDNGNHVFEAEGLALVAKLRPGASLAPGNIESGMLRSRWFGQYGYYEVSMKVPPGLGMWPAFWLNPQDAKWPPEIDVVEIVNNGRDTTRNSFHIVHGIGRQAATYSLLDQWYSYRPGFDYAAGFHKFAVEWTPDRVRHFVDDVLVSDQPYRWLHNDGADGGPAHVLVNLAVGGSWPGAPVASSLPAKLVVKHIRVWQR